MDLVPTVTQALVGAVITGVFGFFTWWLTRRSERPARRNAWQKQAEALRNELRTVYTARIDSLEARCAAQDHEVAAKDAEINRLNRLLNQKRRGSGND